MRVHDREPFPDLPPGPPLGLVESEEPMRPAVNEAFTWQMAILDRYASVNCASLFAFGICRSRAVDRSTAARAHEGTIQ